MARRRKLQKAAPKNPYRRMLAVLRERKDQGAPEWSVYIVRCNDGSLYTGVAKDVDARVEQHNSGKGAAYTRTRRPVALSYRENGLTRSGALVREAQIKRLPRERKQELLAGQSPAVPALAGAIRIGGLAGPASGSDPRTPAPPRRA